MNPAVVIQGAGKTPYLYNKQADQFTPVYPSNGTGPVYHPAGAGEHYVRLMLDQEPVPE